MSAAPLLLSFYWSPERQEIAVDGERFAHPVATRTQPSHDLAHLLAAASGLAWKPAGTREQICFAELHSVFLERLLGAALGVVLLEQKRDLGRTLDHTRWFVAEHYAPFPVGFEEALERLRRALDGEALLRLSPLFFRARAFELKHQDSRERTFSASFSSMLAPRASGLLHDARAELARYMAALELGVSTPKA